MWGRNLHVALLGGDFWHSGDRRCVALGEPVCAASVGSAGTGDCEHLFLPRAHGAGGASAGGCGGGAVVHSGDSLQAISDGNFCAKRGVIGSRTGQMESSKGTGSL